MLKKNMLLLEMEHSNKPFSKRNEAELAAWLHVQLADLGNTLLFLDEARREAVVKAFEYLDGSSCLLMDKNVIIAILEDCNLSNKEKLVLSLRLVSKITQENEISNEDLGRRYTVLL